MFKYFKFPLVAALATCATAPLAGVCDYRPSLLVGSPNSLSAAAGTAAGAGAGAAAAGIGAKAAGFYTLTHSVTGLTMLGSKAAGSSAAGTVGIISGTSGLIGTTAGFLMSPVVITGAAIAAVGIGGYEGVCFFKDDRVTEYAAVDLVMKNIGQNANPEVFRYVEGPLQKSRVLLLDEDNQWQTYLVTNLYIVNGTLMHRNRFRNTTIGDIGFVSEQAE